MDKKKLRDDQCYTIFFFGYCKDYRDKPLGKNDVATILRLHSAMKIESLGDFKVYGVLEETDRGLGQMVNHYATISNEVTRFFEKKARDWYEDCSRRGLMQFGAFQP